MTGHKNVAVTSQLNVFLNKALKCLQVEGFTLPTEAI